jgi:hypothetical protein
VWNRLLAGFFGLNGLVVWKRFLGEGRDTRCLVTFQHQVRDPRESCKIGQSQ